jgi:hydroxypyruvate isomerase
MTFDLSPNLTWLFTEAGDSPGARIRAASAAGFRFADTWPLPQSDQIEDYLAAVRETGITIVVATAPLFHTGDAALLDAHLDAFSDAIPVAREAGVQYLVVTGGLALEGVEPAEQRAVIVEFLTRAADLVDGSGVGLLLENLSIADDPECFLVSTAETIAIVREVNRPEVGVLYDAYHSLEMGERIAEVLEGAAELVKHVQIADVPGRNEPGTGTADWDAVLADLAEAGYTGPLGLEYEPTGESVASTAHIAEAVGSFQRRTA